VYGERNPRKAWRQSPMAWSACLRSVREDAFYYHQLGTELSPREGGPPV
jgi:hypothetical protein